MQREPCRFDAARGQNDRALRIHRKELALPVHIDFDRVHLAVRRVQLDDVRQGHQKKPAVRVVHAGARRRRRESLRSGAACC